MTTPREEELNEWAAKFVGWRLRDFQIVVAPSSFKCHVSSHDFSAAVERKIAEMGLQEKYAWELMNLVESDPALKDCDTLLQEKFHGYGGVSASIDRKTLFYIATARPDQRLKAAWATVKGK